jgi:hypothetical protein
MRKVHGSRCTEKKKVDRINMIDMISRNKDPVNPV